MTDPERIRQNPKSDRTVCLYGYMRGAHLKNESKVHIMGESLLLISYIICQGLKKSLELRKEWEMIWCLILSCYCIWGSNQGETLCELV